MSPKQLMYKEGFQILAPYPMSLNPSFLALLVGHALSHLIIFVLPHLKSIALYRVCGVGL